MTRKLRTSALALVAVGGFFAFCHAQARTMRTPAKSSTNAVASSAALAMGASAVGRSPMVPMIAPPPVVIQYPGPQPWWIMVGTSGVQRLSMPSSDALLDSPAI